MQFQNIHDPIIILKKKLIFVCLFVSTSLQLTTNLTPERGTLASCLTSVAVFNCVHLISSMNSKKISSDLAKKQVSKSKSKQGGEPKHLSGSLCGFSSVWAAEMQHRPGNQVCLHLRPLYPNILCIDQGSFILFSSICQKRGLVLRKRCSPPVTLLTTGETCFTSSSIDAAHPRRVCFCFETLKCQFKCKTITLFPTLHHFKPCM